VLDIIFFDWAVFFSKAYFRFCSEQVIGLEFFEKLGGAHDNYLCARLILLPPSEQSSANQRLCGRAHRDSARELPSAQWVVSLSKNVKLRLDLAVF